jgi:hypothetical protein
MILIGIGRIFSAFVVAAVAAFVIGVIVTHDRAGAAQVSTPVGTCQVQNDPLAGTRS